MWRYQKPGFESLLVSELQKQQQHQQFCDTLLTAGGISVPAHSCVLSAISPHASSVLSSMPSPPAGQSRLLDIHTLGACTLLHIVKLLYSGEMAGEGEKDKQEAIAAAAVLGIQGLVEVTRRDDGSGGGQQVEVGVQTEPLEETEERGVRWRRKVKCGETLLWKETISVVERDMWTQTEERNTAPPAESAASFEIISLSDLQLVQHTASQKPTPQTPYVPISMLYQPENQIDPPPSVPTSSELVSSAAGHTPYHDAQSQTVQPCSTLVASNMSSWCSVSDTEAEKWQEEQLQQFRGNIPGFINDFLNPERVEGSRRRRPRTHPKGRARQRRGRGARRSRSTTEGGRRVTKPRGSRWLTHKVDVQHVGLRSLQKKFLHRLGTGLNTTGQGGGATGRKLFLKTRKELMMTKSHQNTRRRSKTCEVILSEEPGGGHTPVSQRSQNVLPASHTQTSRALSTTSYSSTPAHFYTGSSAHLQPSPGPATLYLSPAESCRYTTPLPPPEPPLPEDQPEHIDRLLEEVMMGLDILPKTKSVAAAHSPDPTSSSRFTYLSSGNGLVPNNQHISTGSANEPSVSTSGQGAVPVLQQHGGEEMNDMLESFLQSFEKHIENCPTKEEEVGGERSAGPKETSRVLNKRRNPKTRTPQSPHLQNEATTTFVSHQQTVKPQRNKDAAAAQFKVPKQPAKATAGVVRTKRQRKKKGRGLYRLPSERKPFKKKTVPPSDLPDLTNKRLQLMPVVKLERRHLMLQELSWNVKTPALYTSRLSTEKRAPRAHRRLELQDRRTYPIRSRMKVADLLPEEQFRVQPQEEPSIPPQEELVVQPQESTLERRKRRMVSDVVMITAAKRVCSEQMTHPTTEPCARSSALLVCEGVNAQAEEEIDVETVSLSSAEDGQNLGPTGSCEEEDILVEENSESNGDDIVVD